MQAKKSGQNFFPWFIFLLISTTHYCLSLAGFFGFSLSDYHQLVQNQFPTDTPFWEALFWFHGNPPLLSAIHFLAQKLFPKNPTLLFDLILPLFHGISFLLFYEGLPKLGICISKWIPVFLFLNPLVFIYFKYPFYTPLLFFATCIFVFLLGEIKQKPTAIFYLAALFSFGSLLRASWQMLLFIPLLVWLGKHWNLKRICLLLLICLPPILWQAKNALIIGQFTSSSWLGINLARGHLPWKVHKNLVDFVPPFSLPSQYLDFMQREPRIARAMENQSYYLSKNNLNHASIPVVSQLYIESIAEQFSISWSLNTILNGVLIFFQSPVNETHIRHHLKESGFEIPHQWNPDFWEPIGFQNSNSWYLFFAEKRWDPGGQWSQWWKGLTLYSLIYPFFVLWHLFYWRSLGREIKVLTGLVIFFSILYITVDNFESQRMRMEIEPWFWILGLHFVHKFRSRKKGKEKMVVATV